MSTTRNSTVGIAEALEPLVLAMDIGSTSTRACLYDALARPIANRAFKADHSFYEAADGTAEIDADLLTAEISQAITTVVEGIEPGRVRGVAMDTFASSIICVDARGLALTPCITYADSRSAPQLAHLRDTLDEAAVHQSVGVRLHTSYHPSRLLWLAQAYPEIVARTRRFLSIGEYVYERLAGVTGAATSAMAWTGLLNRHTGDLDVELLAASKTSREQFGSVVDPDQPRPASNPDAATRWPALSGALWFPAIPDGYASNLGAGATGPEAVALSAATSGAMRVIVPGTPARVPAGLWAYRVSRDESLIGGALNDVGRVITWLRSTLAPVDPAALDHALRRPACAGIPMVLPFFTGERATGWSGDARAIFAGVSSASTSLDLWRGACEGVAISYRRVFEQLALVNPQIQSVVALGGVTHHVPGLLDIVAQALGTPVRVVDAQRVTMRGTAVFALRVLNPRGSFAEIPLAEASQPDPGQCAYYDDLLRRFEDTYAKVIAS